MDPIDFHMVGKIQWKSMGTIKWDSSKYLLLCSAEQRN